MTVEGAAPTNSSGDEVRRLTIARDKAIEEKHLAVRDVHALKREIAELTEDVRFGDADSNNMAALVEEQAQSIAELHRRLADKEAPEAKSEAPAEPAPAGDLEEIAGEVLELGRAEDVGVMDTEGLSARLRSYVCKAPQPAMDHSQDALRYLAKKLHIPAPAPFEAPQPEGALKQVADRMRSAYEMALLGDTGKQIILDHMESWASTIEAHQCPPEEKLPCGHPAVCYFNHVLIDDVDEGCSWCEDLSRVRDETRGEALDPPASPAGDLEDLALRLDGIRGLRGDSPPSQWDAFSSVHNEDLRKWVDELRAHQCGGEREAELADAKRRSEYWKSEHLAGNDALSASQARVEDRDRELESVTDALGRTQIREAKLFSKVSELEANEDAMNDAAVSQAKRIVELEASLKECTDANRASYEAMVADACSLDTGVIAEDIVELSLQRADDGLVHMSPGVLHDLAAKVRLLGVSRLRSPSKEAGELADEIKEKRESWENEEGYVLDFGAVALDTLEDWEFRVRSLDGGSRECQLPDMAQMYADQSVNAPEPDGIGFTKLSTNPRTDPIGSNAPEPKKPLDCGHPAVCHYTHPVSTEDSELEEGCAWCDDLRRVRDETLADQEPEKCGTCGGDGMVSAPGVKVMDHTKEPPIQTTVFPDPDVPCPDCAEPPGGQSEELAEAQRMADMMGCPKRSTLAERIRDAVQGLTKSRDANLAARSPLSEEELGTLDLSLAALCHLANTVPMSSKDDARVWQAINQLNPIVIRHRATGQGEG